MFLLKVCLMESGNEITTVMDFMFHHANGKDFWDLVQPFFMFIVGVSIPLSNTNRKKKGDTDKAIRNHRLEGRFTSALWVGALLYWT